MTIELKPEIAAALESLATAKGLSVEAYLEQLVERELPVRAGNGAASEGSGLVLEDGLLVYRTGRPLPSNAVEDVLRQIREERADHILGHRS
jgi:hypothetical protein